MNSENSKTFDPYRFVLHLIDKIDFKRNDKYIPLSYLSIYETCKTIKKSYKNNKIKISAPLMNNEFELPDGSYSVADIRNILQTF